MTRKGLLLALLFAGLAPIPAVGVDRFSEPRLVLAHAGASTPRVALTLDACSGRSDQRIFGALVKNAIPATVFVTARWLKVNGDTMKLMLSRPDLFQIENHGAMHIPAVDVPAKIYGIATAGSPAAVQEEVEGGRLAILAATGQSPLWYRGATGFYTNSSISEIEGLGQAVAGYSLKADDGASLPAAAVVKRLATAKDGDVIIAHVNHPERSSGAGVVQGILALKARGYQFVKLGLPPKAAPRAS